MVGFHKKDYPEKSIMSLWRQVEAFDMPFTITKKYTNPNQTSITPHANLYRQMLSYNINRPIIYYKKNMKKEAEKWKLIYIFFLFLYFLKVICNLDNVILTLPKTMTKNEKWFVFSKKKQKKKEKIDEPLKQWKIIKNNEKRKCWTACFISLLF